MSNTLIWGQSRAVETINVSLLKSFLFPKFTNDLQIETFNLQLFTFVNAADRIKFK